VILLHRWPTPKGKKVTILLEELGMPYNVVPCNIGKGDQFEPDFLKISPNIRMPAIVDHAPADGGPPISVFESGAIMMYKADGDVKRDRPAVTSKVMCQVEKGWDSLHFCFRG